MSTFLLQVLLAFMILTSFKFIKQEAECSCTKGFMDKKLLRTRATQIGSNLSSSVNLSEIHAGYSVWPALTFTCSGNITGLILAVKVWDLKAEFPTFDIWRTSQTQDKLAYFKVSSTEISITPSQYATNGVSVYNLSTPLAFESGDIVGIYQPPTDHSWVQFYEASAKVGASFTSISDVGSTFLPYSDNVLTDSGKILVIHPVTNNPKCLSGFLDEDTVTTRALEIPGVRKNPGPRLFPEINFSCSGWISKWTFAGEFSEGVALDSVQTKLQLWRGETIYTKVAETSLQQVVADSSRPNVYNMYMEPPMEFQAGDFLGIDQQFSEKNAGPIIYDQQCNGPSNLAGSHELSTIISPSVLVNNDFPLITIETTSIGGSTSSFTGGSQSSSSSHPVPHITSSPLHHYTQSQNTIDTSTLDPLPSQTPTTEHNVADLLTTSIFEIIQSPTSVPSRSGLSPSDLTSSKQIIASTATMDSILSHSTQAEYTHEVSIITCHVGTSSSTHLTASQQPTHFFSSVFNLSLIVGLGGLVLLLNIFLCILVGALCCRRRHSKIKRSTTLPHSLQLPASYVSPAGVSQQEQAHYQRNQINLETGCSRSDTAGSTEVRYVPTTTNSVYLEETPSYCQTRHSNQTPPTDSKGQYSVPQVHPRGKQALSYMEYNQAYHHPSASTQTSIDHSSTPEDYAIPLAIPNSYRCPSFMEYNHAYNLPVPSSSLVKMDDYDKLRRSDSTQTISLSGPVATNIHPDILQHSHPVTSAQNSLQLVGNYSTLMVPNDYLVPVQNQSKAMIHEYEEIRPRVPIKVKQNLAYSTSYSH